MKKLVLFCAFVCAALAAGAALHPKKSGAPAMGVYRWGAANPNGGAKCVEAFGEWIGERDVWGEDFEAIDRWENNIAGGNWQLPEWGAWKKKNPSRRRLILSVPLLPGGWDRSGSRAEHEKGRVSLAQGAKGEYNRYFESLAKMLVANGLDDTILRLGWEMNGGWYTWRASGEAADFAGYFREIVKTMRAVPGARKLQFCWNPALGWQQFPCDQCYPGDEWVDYIGVDVYDDSWAKQTYPLEDGMSEKEKKERRQRAWDEWIWGGNFGIKWFIDFAKKHKKPLCFPEWGVSKREDRHGGLDNPKFIENMHRVIMDRRNNVAWHCYFDVEAGDGHHQLSPGKDGNHQTIFPKSAEKFRELFGKQGKKR
jgi:hypothetical protein